MNAAQAEFTEIAIGELHCPSCAAGIERHLKQLAGVTACQVNFGAARVGVAYDPEQITLPHLEAALEGLGHSVRRPVANGQPARRLTPERLRLLATALGTVLTFTGYSLQWTGFSPAAWILCYLLGMIAGGAFIFRGAWGSVWNRRTADMNVLMTVAAVGAAALGDWAEAATVLLLFSVAEALESFSLDRARRAIRGLIEAAPEEATLLDHGHETSIPVREVRAGQTLVVRPGSRIPLDGEVTEGRSSVNEAAITGESAAAVKSPGDRVYAGTLNEAGRLLVRVTHAAGDTTLDRIVTLVEEAQARQSPVEKLVDRFARVYTPAVMGLALLLMAAPLLLGGDAKAGFYRALSLLIIACPCALVISTPVAMVCGLTRAARGGVLIKGGQHLERLGSLRAVAFDKTGTLTHGRPVVSAVIPLAGLAPQELLALAAAAEEGSEHAVGRAVVRAAREQDLSIPRVDEFEAAPGLGVRAVVGGAHVLLGRPQWLREQGYDTTPLLAQVEALEAAGNSVVLVAQAGSLAGAIAITDQTREIGAAAIRALKALGIPRIVMLTGDNAAAGRNVAAAIGIEEFHAGLLPVDKVERVQRLQEEAGAVAMVGDGINDAPALAAAAVGIAMGSAGTDVAIETADVALMGDDLSRLPFVIRLSRGTLGIVRQNIAFSILVKAGFIALTLAGASTLWLAVLADTGTSVLVVLNSLRLLRFSEGRVPAAQDNQPVLHRGLADRAGPVYTEAH